MDACSKSQKLCEGHTVMEDEDRISNLPDTVLSHILSFLPTKYAVRTSILSTKWEYLWTSVPILDFQDSVHECMDENEVDDMTFVQFVDRVLTLHEVTNIQRFRLSCTMNCTAPRINAWVSTAVRRNVQELDLTAKLDMDIDVEEPFMLPPSLLTCESLRMLTLKMIYCNLNLPTSVILPNLKILDLNGVVFPNENSVQKLLSGCPVLEKLIVLEIAWSGLKTVDVSVSALKQLELPFDDFCSGDFDDGKISFSAVNLTSFKYEGTMSCEYSLSNLTSIVDAHVHASIFDFLDRFEERGSRACNLLKGLYNVEVLTLSNRTLETLTYAKDFLAQLPTFYKLRYLDMHMEYGDCNCGTLMDLLHTFPKLESLVFSQGFDPLLECEVDDWMSIQVPECFISSVKEIKFEKFRGVEHELCLIRFLLQISAALKRMTIICSEDLSSDIQKQVNIREQVLMFPRGSSNGIIMFS